MAILSHSSTDLMLSLKIVLISTSVLGAAVMLKFSFPAITDFAMYDLPSIYNLVVSWLRPPYLYLVINCIIITIVASSKLQSKKHDHSAGAAEALILDNMVHVQSPPMMPIVKAIQTDFDAAAEYKYNGVVLNNNGGHEVEVGKGFGFDAYELADARIIGNEAAFTANIAAPDAAVEDVMSNKENEFVISKATRMPPMNEDSTYYTPTDKPPASARFGHRRNVKASPEGSKSLLGVSKTKRQDTLESTWKTITEGRAMPLTRHIRKSDTWERDHHHPHGGRHHLQQLEKTPQKMTKAETFKDRTNATSPLLTPSPVGGGGLGKLKKEPSLGQDELNKRVEAFIKKFNEDMRLQRQESLNQYMEMINRGSH